MGAEWPRDASFVIELWALCVRFSLAGLSYQAILIKKDVQSNVSFLIKKDVQSNVSLDRLPQGAMLLAQPSEKL
jgi:hypothetical protein